MNILETFESTANEITKHGQKPEDFAVTVTKPQYDKLVERVGEEKQELLHDVVSKFSYRGIRIDVVVDPENER
jgi:hypothetical protein